MGGLVLCTALLMSGQPAAGQDVATQGTHLAVDVSRTDGRIAMSLLGNIWLLPQRGGAAVRLTDSTLPALRPRWSPDGLQILYQTSGIDASQLWLAQVSTGQSIQLGSPSARYQQAAWHPGGERIVFSSWRRASGLDLWELDLQTGMEWRLSNGPGDETEPAWSADGRDLAYIRHEGNTWALVVRRLGEPDSDLVVADTPLASPSWRPDGTLISFFGKSENGYSMQMAILSEPTIERPFGSSENYFLAPVSWLDRDRLYYASDGGIRTREFGEWQSHAVPFRAEIGKPEPRAEYTIATHDLPLLTPPSGKLVIRSSRIFDGLARGYRDGLDVLLDGGIIEAVVPRQNWPDLTVLDVGEATLIPGFIDAYSAMPDGPANRTGAELLAYGVTTLVSTYGSTFDPAAWEGGDEPGPRALRAANLTAANAGDPIALVSGLASAETPGIESLYRSRQATRYRDFAVSRRRLSAIPDIDAGFASIVLGSKPNGMPPGLALHAELRALSAAGLDGDQVLKAAGQNAARILGLSGTLGQITPGARADLLLVSGDPLVNVADALNIIAVVRNGRFFSVVSLLERAKAADGVE